MFRVDHLGGILGSQTPFNLLYMYMPPFDVAHAFDNLRFRKTWSTRLALILEEIGGFQKWALHYFELVIPIVDSAGPTTD
jgi:hypothetical protein